MQFIYFLNRVSVQSLHVFITLLLLPVLAFADPPPHLPLQIGVSRDFRFSTYTSSGSLNICGDPDTEIADREYFVGVATRLVLSTGLFLYGDCEINYFGPSGRIAPNTNKDLGNDEIFYDVKPSDAGKKLVFSATPGASCPEWGANYSSSLPIYVHIPKLILSTFSKSPDPESISRFTPLKDEKIPFSIEGMESCSSFISIDGRWRSLDKNYIDWWDQFTPPNEHAVMYFEYLNGSLWLRSPRWSGTAANQYTCLEKNKTWRPTKVVYSATDFSAHFVGGSVMLPDEYFFGVDAPNSDGESSGLPVYDPSRMLVRRTSVPKSGSAPAKTCLVYAGAERATMEEFNSLFRKLRTFLEKSWQDKNYREDRLDIDNFRAFDVPVSVKESTLIWAASQYRSVVFSEEETHLMQGFGLLSPEEGGYGMFYSDTTLRAAYAELLPKWKTLAQLPLKSIDVPLDSLVPTVCFVSGEDARKAVQLFNAVMKEVIRLLTARRAKLLYQSRCYREYTAKKNILACLRYQDTYVISDGCPLVPTMPKPW